MAYGAVPERQNVNALAVSKTLYEYLRGFALAPIPQKPVGQGLAPLRTAPAVEANRPVTPVTLPPERIPAARPTKRIAVAVATSVPKNRSAS